MNRMFRRRRLVSKPLASCFALFLTLTLTVPVWAGAGGTFTNPATITINDPIAVGVANPYPSNISVSGMAGTVTNVAVTLNNINHTFPTDMEMLLVGPTGTNLILFADASNGNDITNTTISFADGAPAIPGGTITLSNGTYSPTNVAGADVFPAPAPAPSANTTLAAAFNGIDPNGTWSLYITDEVGGDVGTLGNGWSLSITTSGSSATNFSNGAAIFVNDASKGKASLYPSPITVSGLAGGITDVNVTLTNVNHTFVDDVDIFLVGPSGKRIILMSDVGGDPDLVGVNITFDDQAATALADAGPIATGSFRPTNIGTGDIFPDLLPPFPTPGTAGGVGASATLASVFNGTDPNGVWKLYVVDAFTPDPGVITGGWSITITAGGSLGAKRFTPGDFDGDGKTDVAVRRDSTREWYWRESTAYSNRAYSAFGAAGDIPVPGDYDGDKKTDIAVFRPSNAVWYIVQSGTNTLRQSPWGQNGDIPVPQDYDGDGATDLAVFRGGSWFVFQSTTNTGRGVVWGSAGDIPVAGNFEGTAGADFTVFRPSENNWYILNNAGTSNRAISWGATGDRLVPGDYDADGKTDAAVYRPTTGDWFILRSGVGTSISYHLGATGDIPAPGEFDGDSRTDIAVWRPSTGSWYILNSSVNVISNATFTAALRIDNWGQTGDTPIPTYYLPQQP